MTDELSSNAIGNVVIGENAPNTHVVNELGMPVFCNGVSDVVVAASPDGILVCGKEYSENIKNYVDNLSPRPMYEERRWGSYRVLDTTTYNDGYMSLTKVLQLKSGRYISYQLHNHREEMWTIVDGEGVVVIDGAIRNVTRGDVVAIKKGQKFLEAEDFYDENGNSLVEGKVALVKGSKNRNRKDLGSRRAKRRRRIRCGADHRLAADGVDGHKIDAKLAAGSDRTLDRAGNIVEFKVEKDLFAEILHRLHDIGTLGRVKLKPDFFCKTAEYCLATINALHQ